MKLEAAPARPVSSCFDSGHISCSSDELCAACSATLSCAETDIGISGMNLIKIN